MPFTKEQFFNVFAQYNSTVWPAQIVFYLLALVALVLAVKKMKHADGIISAILAFFWVWMGAVYHLTFFTAINKPAYVFGSVFILQGLLFFASGTLRQKLSFRPQLDLYGISGGVFLLYGLVIYPVLGYFLGHVYPQAPTFGVPCPTTIFTFGLLLWTGQKFPKYLLFIPLLWSVIGFSAAFQWDVWEDIMLLVAGLGSTALIVYRDRVQQQPVSSPLTS